MTTHVEAAIDKYFEGRIEDVKERDALFGHLDRCDGCRRRFDEVALVQRALSGDRGVPAAELALIGRTVIAAAAPVKKPAWSAWFWVSRIAAPVAALGAAAVLFLGPSQFTAKGGGEQGTGVGIEVLCFDRRAEQTKVLRASGDCPAPGVFKLVYASAHSVDHLSVRAKDLKLEIDAPAPRSSLPGYVEFEAGERIEVWASADGEETRIAVRGVAP